MQKEDSKAGRSGEPAVASASDVLEQERWADAAIFDLDMRGMIDDAIPLGRWNEKSDSGQALGKIPNYKRWPDGPPPGFDTRAIRDHLLAGCNVGLLLRDGNAVIDDDPRNRVEGDDPIARLFADAGMDIEAFPTVDTGGGGRHFHMHVPPNIALVGSLQNYRGIDFKYAGSQVVTAGRHLSGRLYRWKDSTPYDRPMATEGMLALIRRPSALVVPLFEAIHTPEEVGAMLAGLDITNYRDHDRWLHLMMACHQASGGEAVEQFVEFSTGDPPYGSHGPRSGSGGGASAATGQADAPRGRCTRSW